MRILLYIYRLPCLALPCLANILNFLYNNIYQLGNIYINFKYFNKFLRSFAMKQKTKILALVLVLFCSANLFGQNIGEKTGNKAWDYMHGRSLFGINFGTTLWAGVFDQLLGTDLLPIEKMLVSGDADITGLNLTKKHWAFGLGFSYDFAPLNFMSVGLDIGFAVGQFSVEQNKINYHTIPWSLNVKFFFWKKAPFGFFLSPRFGGTAFVATGSGANVDANGITRLSSHGGFYLSLELGWRIQLFPKRGANWPVQVGIDISLFDVGYYVAPWASPILSISQFQTEEELSSLGINKYMNVRLLILPRLGITIRF